MLGLFAATVFTLQVMMCVVAMACSAAESISGMREDSWRDLRAKSYSVSSPSGQPFVPYFQ